MNRNVKGVIERMKSKMSGYVYLLDYRYQNICVKANPVSLLAVKVEVDEEEHDIEEVAQCGLLNDYELFVLPNDEEDTGAIAKSVLLVHPEFKQDIRMLDSQEDELELSNDEEAREYGLGASDSGEVKEDRHILVFKMPEVDMDRHDAMMDLVKTLGDQCKAQLDICRTVFPAEAAAYLIGADPKDKKKAEDAIKQIDEWHTQTYEKLVSEKKKEIDDAYAEYLASGKGTSGEDDNANSRRMTWDTNN